MTIEVRQGYQTDGINTIPTFFVEDINTHEIHATATSEFVADKICKMLKESTDWIGR